MSDRDLNRKFSNPCSATAKSFRLVAEPRRTELISKVAPIINENNVQCYKIG